MGIQYANPLPLLTCYKNRYMLYNIKVQHACPPHENAMYTWIHLRVRHIGL